METTQIAKQMIGFQKTVFENSFNALAVVQDQTEKMISNLVDQIPTGTGVNEDAKKQMMEAFSYTKKAREEFKKAVDEGYSSFEKMFNQK
ncbi:MAG: hypothetical protein ABIJ59_11180 [Pseudomonadota bacterium]